MWNEKKTRIEWIMNVFIYLSVFVPFLWINFGECRVLAVMLDFFFICEKFRSAYLSDVWNASIIYAKKYTNTQETKTWNMPTCIDYFSPSLNESEYTRTDNEISYVLESDRHTLDSLVLGSVKRGKCDILHNATIWNRSRTQSSVLWERELQKCFLIQKAKSRIRERC